MEGRALGFTLTVLALGATFACQRPEPTEAPEEAAPAAPPGAEYEGEAFTFHQIQDDIYHAVGTGNLSVGCNGSIVINDDDVLIVDSHITPAAAWALLKELKNITDKPVRYVVNTHFHFDHTHGNQVFPEDVEIIGHEFTREQLASGGSTSGRAYEMFVGGIPERLEELERDLQTAIDATDPFAEERLRHELDVQQNYYEATQAVEPTPPTITLTKRMTLFRGGREIELLFFGRGHTAGDVVVYLPDEKVLITGDLLTGGLSYMGDGYLNEWADTLEEVKKLDFDVVLPGHGEAFRNKEKIDHFQAYLRDLWDKIAEAHGSGMSVEEASEQIDMTNHSENYPSLTEPGVHPHAVARVYALLEGTER